MRNRSTLRRHALPFFTAVLVTVLGVAAVAMAAGGATSSKTGKLKVKCPTRVLAGKKVTCKAFGHIPAGVSGYEVVNQTFKEVFIENSGGMRGLSEVKTVNCPAGKRVIAGGTNLGTNATQNGQQRSVSVSMSAPNGTGTGWSAQLFNNETTGGGTSIDLQIYAICANVS